MASPTTFLVIVAFCCRMQPTMAARTQQQAVKMILDEVDMFKSNDSAVRDAVNQTIDCGNDTALASEIQELEKLITDCIPFPVIKNEGGKTYCRYSKGHGEWSAAGAQCAGKQGGDKACKKFDIVSMSGQCISVGNKCAMTVYARPNVVFMKSDSDAEAELASQRATKSSECATKEAAALETKKAALEASEAQRRLEELEPLCDPFPVIKNEGGITYCRYSKGHGEWSAAGAKCAGKQGGDKTCKKFDIVSMSGRCISLGNKCAMTVYDRPNVVFTKD